MDGDAPARATATRHRSSAHRALSTARGPRARDGPPRRARRHRGTVAPTRIARPRVERRGVGAAIGAGGFSDRRGSRTRSRRPPTLAAHPREALDGLLALLDSHRRGIHRPPGTRARDSSQESRCRARLDDDASRFSLHGRMRAAGAVVPGESLARSGRCARAGDPGRQDRMAGAVCQHAHGDPRSRDVRASRVARRQTRARAWSDVSLGADHRCPRTTVDVAAAARGYGDSNRRHRLPAALLLGRPRRQSRPALARASLWRRHALWLRRRARRDGPPAFRLAPRSARLPGAELAVRHRAAVRRRLARQCPYEGSDGGQPPGVRPPLHVASDRPGPRRGFLPRRRAPLWDEDSRTPRRHRAVLGRRRRLNRRPARVDARAAMWRDLLLFGEHTWGADESVTAPTSRQTVAQWEYKRRFIDAGAAEARDLLSDALLRLGRATQPGRGRLVFNAGNWERTDVVRVVAGAGKRLSSDGREMASVDLEEGEALVLIREVPPLGYLALREADGDPRPPTADGEALEAKTGGFTVQLDPATGAIRSLTGPDGKERVKASDWSGLNQLVYARGGEHSAMWTSVDRDDLKNPPQLALTQAKFVRCRRERLPGIGVRLIVERALDGFPSITSIVTLYDELPWVDIENRITKTATLAKEALYFGFPWAFTKPTVEVEVPLGRMTVDRDQQPGSCRDWYCHAHWVWLHEASDGVLWSGPDTP